MKSEIKITKVVQDIYCIEEMDYKEHCNCYFIVGEEKCLLVDFGIGLIDFEIILSKISYGKEIIKVLTHFHFDHFGGAFNFGKIIANKNNIGEKDVGLNYFNKHDFEAICFFDQVKNNFSIIKNNFVQAVEGEIINLGNYKFQILFTPGHDETSISLFEIDKKILISGDLIYRGEIFLNFLDSDILKYEDSLEKIKKLAPKLVLGGHNVPINDLKGILGV